MKPIEGPLFIPMKTVSGMNAHELPIARHSRVKRERKTVGGYLYIVKKPDVPCSVLLTRSAPSAGLDDDNLLSALKTVRDTIATWLGVDDRHRDIVRYRYSQERGPLGVRVEFGPPIVGGHIIDPGE